MREFDTDIGGYSVLANVHDVLFRYAGSPSSMVPESVIGTVNLAMKMIKSRSQNTSLSSRK